MAGQEFPAQRRTLLGKKVKQLRRAGRIPGVVYGPVVKDTVPVTVDQRTFAKFYQASGHSTLFVLRWEDGDESVFIREVQMDPVRREPIHIDFFAPNLRMPVRATVPVVFHRPAQLIDAMLSEIRTDIEVEALPATIPHQIDVDVSALMQPGDAVRVGDLTLPEGVTAVTDLEETLARVDAVYREPVAEEEDAAAEGGEAAAPVGESAGGGESDQ